MYFAEWDASDIFDRTDTLLIVKGHLEAFSHVTRLCEIQLLVKTLYNKSTVMPFLNIPILIHFSVLFIFWFKKNTYRLYYTTNFVQLLFTYIRGMRKASVLRWTVTPMHYAIQNQPAISRNDRIRFEKTRKRRRKSI